VSDDVYVGAVAPATCVMVVTDPGYDLSAVTAGSFIVQKPGALEETWPATLAYDGAALELTVSHAFQPGDINAPGTYAVFAELATPEGTVRTKTRTFVAKKKFDTTL
jgi:hypothetical protein